MPACDPVKWNGTPAVSKTDSFSEAVLLNDLIARNLQTWHFLRYNPSTDTQTHDQKLFKSRHPEFLPE
ncbi:MAG TPA: hypothetical protein VGI38_13035 [Puia sp.]